ncbi:MAG: hypothetical protein RI897_1559 [Verrucomicrobiota bacterium]|jgi:hypothetical protein
MTRIDSLILAAATLATAASLCADVLELKNGTLLNGKYVGGTTGTVRFEALGSMQVIATSDIIALTFTSAAGVAPAPTAATPPPLQTPPAAVALAAATPAEGPEKVTLPAGTLLLVRMKDSISSKNPAGTPFTTKIEYDLVVNGTKVVPAGTVIYGKVLSSTQARRIRGQSTLDLRLTQIALGGTPVTISTSGFKQAGEKSIKDAASGAAAGAAIGAIVDGGEGAGKGAAIGASVGALKKGESVTIPPGMLIEFNLTRPCTLAVGGK